MNAEIRAAIEKYADDAADLFRQRLLAALMPRPPGKPRKKPPIQLCPVPGCANRAAPVFGMVCAKHKGVSKNSIAKYRAARKAKKVA